MKNAGFNKVKQVSLWQNFCVKNTGTVIIIIIIDTRSSGFQAYLATNYPYHTNLENFFLLKYDKSSNSYMGCWGQYILPLIFERSTSESKGIIMKNSKANSSLEFSKYLRKIDIPLYGSRSEISFLWNQQNPFPEYSKMFYCNFLSSKKTFASLTLHCKNTEKMKIISQ